MDADSLPDDILSDLIQGCGGCQPSAKLRTLVARYIRFLHNGPGGPVRFEVLAMLAAVAGEVMSDPALPKNPFADTPWGTPLTVYRMDSKEVLCNGTWMGVGTGINAHLVKVAMHDDERESQEFDFRQVRLRNPAQEPLKNNGPLEVVPDPVEIDEQEEEEASNGLPDATAGQTQPTAEENSEVEIEDTSIPPEVVQPSLWSTVGEGSLVWMEDGSDGEFLGLDMSGMLKVRVTGKHTGNRFSLYQPDQVRIAEAIPVEHDPVEIGAK